MVVVGVKESWILKNQGEGFSLIRKLTIALDEEEWKKFVESNPQPIQWIIQQIRNFNAESSQPPRSGAS
ncbi:MAG: hypothetical protein HY645_09170 [Acidobacteria bacterium]|nr:hypothetical protein [Acidobacteriota bacterium]